ncbi:MAG: 50S ribosomal protein L25 [Micavibrio aeruginosavorus]|uniref:Large ribosomal subunit protein bL25 n=1 Tax=Micavibrio aeruginosavorus TaxID=349221 RepID=A0A2W5N3V0_9BACT|nr:MAG: 50S ribosomal protein L25 [Micavibrio aeruginosavorus]
MTKHYALSAETRERAGKGVARALRREKKIPAVIYGDAKEAETIELPVKEITLEYHKGHMFTNLCDLTVGSKKQLVLVRDVQVHPVTDAVLHVDFMRVTPKTTITVHVPVHFENEENCPGLKNKGSLTIVRHDVELICKATDIPESITVDLSTFEIGDAIKISNVKLPNGTKPAITNRDFTIATIAAPRLLLEEEDAINAEKAAADAEKAATEAAAAPAEDKK